MSNSFDYFNGAPYIKIEVPWQLQKFNSVLRGGETSQTMIVRISCPITSWLHHGDVKVRQSK